MKKRTTNPYLLFLLCLLFGLLLAQQTQYINPWPTDSITSYIPTARKLFTLSSLSAMHDAPSFGLGKYNMRGKEALVLGIAIMQRLLGDTYSLYPNILFLIIAIMVSHWCIYLIFRRLFDDVTGHLAFLIAFASFWPYMYVLFGSHQPLVFMNFLLTLLMLLYCPKQKFAAIGAGLFFSLMLFSSPTAALYIPYLALPFLLGHFRSSLNKDHLKVWGNSALLFTAAAATVILIFTWPDPIGQFNKFMYYVAKNRFGNHFQDYYSELQRIFPVSTSFRGGGWIWIVKYFLLVMPILFPVYLLSLLKLLPKFFSCRRTFYLILISLSTPIVVEASRMAQFGRNYFSAFFGMLFLICLVWHSAKQRVLNKFKQRAILFLLTSGLLTAHIIFNAWAFSADILPSRMATTRVYEWLVENQVKDVTIYPNHFGNAYVPDVLNNPQRPQSFNLITTGYIGQFDSGLLIVPGISGNVLWSDCVEEHFTQDPVLNRIVASSQLEDLAEATFPSLASSRYWHQEEEVCTFRDLILGQRSSQDRRLSRIFIFDVSRLKGNVF